MCSTRQVAHLAQTGPGDGKEGRTSTWQNTEAAAAAQYSTTVTGRRGSERRLDRWTLFVM